MLNQIKQLFCIHRFKITTEIVHNPDGVIEFSYIPIKKAKCDKCDKVYILHDN